MPPEQLPSDRRDFRKHQRSGSDPRFGGGGLGGGGPNRWREQQHHPHQPPPHAPPYHHHNSHHQQQRWYSEFRSSRPIPPGNGKQGGWHMYPDEAGHGFLPFGSRYGDRTIDDDNFRPCGSRGDGRYFRNSRESRGPSNQKDWRSPSWEPAVSPNGPGRPTSKVSSQKCLEKAETSDCDNVKNEDSSHPLPNSISEQSQSHLKEKIAKNGGTSDGPTSSGPKSDKENGLGSIDWTSLKWTRSGSLSTRGPCFSHSNSSKNMAVDSAKIVAEVQQKKTTPVQSPGAGAACVVSPSLASSDETSSRKKPRLGWGEGLAKYEKKKVDPEDSATKDGLVSNVGNAEISQPPSVNLPVKSPKVATLLDCNSPATPSSVACSSSPGVEEKEPFKATKFDQETANLRCSPNIISQAHYEGPSFNLENLDLTSIANLSSFINELLQPVDPSSPETSYVRTTSMNKLLVWKVEMLKALEVTESEIDSLETELKSLIAEPRRSCSGPAASSSPLACCHLKPCEEQVAASSFTLDATVDDRPTAQEDARAALKDDEVDSPGSATSKLVETLPSAEIAFPSETAKHTEGSDNLNLNNSCNLGSGPSSEDNTVHGGDHKPDASNCQTVATVHNMNCDTDHIYGSLLASNKDIAETALEELNKLLPFQQSLFDILTAYPLQRDSLAIREKFLKKKQFLQFKEKVLALKFRTFQHFWKEGRVVSIRKLRGKSRKKFDPSRTGYKKNRSSNRSRPSYFAGSLRTVPAEEVIEFVNWLLLESALRPCRNTLRMPSLILDKQIKMTRFISNNGLVEDPYAAEKERSMINPWTAVERETFIDKLAAFGKNFSKIASFLEHKTIADCIEFYYKNHKSECFERAGKKPEFANQSKSQPTTYLVGTGKRWNREVNAASLDILGEASVIAANVNDGLETQHKSTSGIYFGASSSHKAHMAADGPLDRSNSLDLYSNETVAADVLAGICGSLSSEAMSSCITSSVDPTDGYQDWKSQRVSSCIKRPLTPDVTQNVDDECSDDSCGEMDFSDWTDEEKSIFTQAVSSYGKDFGMISQCVGTRSRDQCKIFFSKAKKCLGLDLIQPGAANAVSADDVNGGGSDIEDACVVEAGSGICNDSSKQGRKEDVPSADIKSMHESDKDLKSDLKICGQTSGSRPLDSMVAESVLRNSSMDGNKPIRDFNMGRNKKNDVCGLVASSNAKSLEDEEGNDPVPHGSSEADKDLVEFSDGHHPIENDGQGILLTEDDKKVECKNADSSEKTPISCALSGMKSIEPQLAGNVESVQVESVCPKEPDPESRSAGKSSDLPLQQNSCFPSVESSTLFSVPIKYQRHSISNALTNGGANGTNDERSQKIVRMCDCKPNHSSYSLSNLIPVESSQILKGYPVSVQTLKGVNGNVTCKKDVPLHDRPKRDGKLHSDRHTDFSLQKCSGSRQQNDQSRDPSGAPAGCSSDVNKPSGNGDVKLFGKILVSSQQKPNSCMQTSPENNSHHHKVGEQKVLLDSSQSKLDCSNYLVSDNVPARNFDFWDGNGTTTGFAPLSDPTLMLTKYPAAFSSHPNSALNLDQLPLHRVVRNNETPLNGVSAFPSFSNGVAADYQVLRNREIQQPFTIDMKQQPHDVLFSEMQRRNGFGINVVGRGQCSGVSDPVAAIKLQYPKGPNISLQAGNVIREDDTWRSNEDVGR